MRNSTPNVVSEWLTSTRLTDFFVRTSADSDELYLATLVSNYLGDCALHGLVERDEFVMIEKHETNGWMPRFWRRVW